MALLVMAGAADLDMDSLGAASIQGGHQMSFSIESPAFAPGGDIPRKHTCDGPDVSPALRWNEPPAGTKGFALIADDPDAPVGTWVHWVVYDLPAATRELPEGVVKQKDVPGGGRQGTNDFRRLGYGGPCPPPGKPHRYFFKLYALSTALGLEPGATKVDVERAMKGRVLAEASLMGRYRR
ncbi:MAG TPA: YbhB/YbcL family Raf kinase inhibitor-like protein [Terriglobales bacterium]|nr:YbhB/YbcL family Raf kinase inhibitor-like protein [Terriglobales bacterium]